MSIESTNTLGEYLAAAALVLAAAAALVLAVAAVLVLAAATR